MMPYKGYYWTILAPLMKKSITKRFSAELAEKAITNGKEEYRRILKEADDIGKGNPMAMNAYFAYVFVGAWLGSDKEISPDDMSLIMQDVLHKMRPMFSITDINTKNGSKMWYRKMKQYEKWSSDKFDKYPTTWKVGFDEKLHKDGSYYYFTSCPICSYCEKAGITEIMGPLCGTDWLMFQMQHGVLYRDHTLANGDPICDYWVVGDKVKDPE